MARNIIRYIKQCRRGWLAHECDGWTDRQMDRWPLAVARFNMVGCALK